MNLTGKEIKDLAEFAGFSVQVEDEDHLEHEYNIQNCPKQGVRDDDGNVNYYNHVVTCDGCDPGECLPIGDALIIKLCSNCFSCYGPEKNKCPKCGHVEIMRNEP